ncbi:hypothetical protein BH11MYX4_BH11MYX4_02460 [soil metagenome]
MKRFPFFLALGAFGAFGPSVAHAADTTTAVADGVTMIRRTTTTPNIVHVLKVALGTPGVHLGGTTSAQRGRTTSSYAKATGVAAATNGDFFVAGYSVVGLAAGGGAAWTDTADSALSANLSFDDLGNVQFHAATEVLKFNAATMKGVVSGHPQLVKNGVALATNPANQAACPSLAPRTSAGLSQDGKTLYMAVVDGRSSSSVGMTCVQMAALIKSFGAYQAVNLDGGGSTAMYIRGTGVVNRPSDGVERVVGNHLGLYAPRLGSVGSVSGEVYEDPDAKHPLDGASVTISKGGTDTTDVKGLYSLDTLPGTFTVTAKKPGYSVKTMSVVVATGADVKLNLGLTRDPNADFDGDKILDGKDNCPEVANPDQLDTDKDGHGDDCDGDDDGDGVADEDDNCPLVANPDQADADKDGAGDACPPGSGDAGVGADGSVGADGGPSPGEAMAGDPDPVSEAGQGCTTAPESGRAPSGLALVALAFAAAVAWRHRSR